MREIKFRAWDKTKKAMIDSSIDDRSEYDEYWGDCRAIDLGSITNINTNERYHVMQYTGLKDKNGKEIYEGDIVKHLSRIQNTEQTDVVEWNDNAAFDGIYQNGTDEVIGNIYENPELLK